MNFLPAIKTSLRDTGREKQFSYLATYCVILPVVITKGLIVFAHLFLPTCGQRVWKAVLHLDPTRRQLDNYVRRCKGSPLGSIHKKMSECVPQG